MKKDKKKPYVILDNSGKVFYSHNNSDLGTLKCGKCHNEKPFQELRWSEKYTTNLCSDCRELGK